jgi:hypothetical protein
LLMTFDRAEVRRVVKSTSDRDMRQLVSLLFKVIYLQTEILDSHTLRMWCQAPGATSSSLRLCG